MSTSAYTTYLYKYSAVVAQVVLVSRSEDAAEERKAFGGGNKSGHYRPGTACTVACLRVIRSVVQCKAEQGRLKVNGSKTS